MAAYSATPRMAVYAAAKAFVLSFTEALWAEMQGSGVTVFALSPGATSTEFNAVVGTEDATAGAKMRTPADVVATALTHLEGRRPWAQRHRRDRQPDRGRPRTTRQPANVRKSDESPH